MESSLYREIFQEGEAKGKAEGEAKGKAEGKAEGEAEAGARLLIRLLLARLGRVAPEVRQAILAQAQTEPEQNSLWFNLLAAADTREAAQQVVRKITAV